MLFGQDAAQGPAVQRTPGDQAEPVGAGGGQNLELDGPLGEVVEGLLDTSPWTWLARAVSWAWAMCQPPKLLDPT